MSELEPMIFSPGFLIVMIVVAIFLVLKLAGVIYDEKKRGRR